METDLKTLLKSMVDQIDLDYDIDPDSVSQELWDLKVEAKLAIKKLNEKNYTKIQKR